MLLMIYNLSLVSPLYRATTVTTLHNIMLVLPPASCHPLITHSSIVLLSLFVVDITSCSLSGLVYRLRTPLLVIAVLQHKMMNNFLLSSKNKGPAANGGVPSAGPSNLVAPYRFTRFGNSAFCIYISCNNRAPLFCFVFYLAFGRSGSVSAAVGLRPSDEHSPTQPPPSLTRSPRELFNILSLALYIFGGARQTLSYPLILTSPFAHNNAELQKCQELSLIQAVSVRAF